MKIRNETIYLIAFSLYCFMALTGGSELILLNDTVKIAIYGIIIILLGLKFITQHISIKKILIYVIIGGVTLYAYLKLDAIFFLMNFLMIISVKDVEVKKIIKTDIAIKCIFLIFHIISYGIDYFFDYNKVQELIMNDGIRIRHAFYFTHPNIISAIIFWLIMDIYYLTKQIKLKHIIMGILLMLVSYSFTKSRTTVFLFILFLIAFFIGKIIKNKKVYYKIIDLTYKYIIEFTTLISILMGILYKYNIYLIRTLLNSLTSGRVYSAYAAFTDFGINLFCNSKALKIEKYLIIDNFYVRCAVLYGLIFVILFAIMTKLVRSKDEKYIKEKIMVIILAISLFSEYSGIIIGNAIPLLLLGKLIVDKDENNERKKESIDYNTNL